MNKLIILNIAEGLGLNITELLKLGSIGLSAVVIISVVYLFKVEAKNDEFHKSKMKFLVIFMAFGFLQILVTSGIELFKYVYPEGNVSKELVETQQELEAVKKELEQTENSDPSKVNELKAELLKTQNELVRLQQKLKDTNSQSGGHVRDESKQYFQVELVYVGDNKMGVIKALRKMRSNLSLSEAKRMVESSPVIVAREVDRETVRKIVNTFKELGAKVVVK